MIATVKGKIRKPYDVNGNKGVSRRVSLFFGDYESDDFSGAVGEGEYYIEVKCPPFIFDKLVVGTDYHFYLDDGKTRIKDAFGFSSDGSLFPLDE